MTTTLTPTDTEEARAYDGKIQVLQPPHNLEWLYRDMAHRGPMLLRAYLVDPLWFRELVTEHLTHSGIQVLTDHRNRAVLAPFCAQHPKLKAASWAVNRTMHDKTILFPALNIAYITTANVTRGSWSLSLNSVLRITSAPLMRHMETAFHEDWRLARPIPAQL